MATLSETQEQAERYLEVGLPPGPKWPKSVQSIVLWTAPVPFLRWCRKRYGRAFTLDAEPSGVGVWLTEAADIKEVFTADPSLVHAGEGNAILAPVLGTQSVLLVDEDDHLRRRKLMLPMFHGRAIEAYRALMARTAQEEIARWKPGVKRLHPRMQALTLEIILRAVLGVEGSPRADDLRRELRDVIDITPVRMLLWVYPKLARFGPWKRYREVQARADAAAVRGDRRPPRRPGARRAHRHPVAAGRRPLRRRRAAHRPGHPRPADHAAARRPRDDRDRPGLGVRAAHPPPRAPAPGDRRRRRGRRGATSTASPRRRCASGR